MIGIDGMEYDPALGLVLLDARPAPIYKVSLLDPPDVGWCAEFLMETGMEVLLFIQPERSDKFRSYISVAFPEEADEGGVYITVKNETIIISPCKTVWDCLENWDQPVKNGAEVWYWLNRLSRMPVVHK